MCLRVNFKKKRSKKINFLASFKSLKKGVGSGVGSGSGSQRCGSGSAPKCHRYPTLHVGFDEARSHYVADPGSGTGAF